MKTIVFIAPLQKGGTYYYYKEISDFIIEHYPKQYNVHFCSSFLEYFLWHFKKADIIFSIIPFFFKPLGAKRYIYNLHGNYKPERKNKWLWVKLLYLAELNLWFADKIMITNYFLADKLGFRKKYESKIFIIPLFIEESKEVYIREEIDSPLHLLTVSSSSFLEKAMWIYDVAKEIFEIMDQTIFWDIVFPWNEQNKKNIQKKISKLKKGENIHIKFHDFLKKKDLNDLYIKSNIFVYATRLDTRWGVIMEACSFWLPIILLPYELWEYIYPDNFVSDNLPKRISEIIADYPSFSKQSFNFVSQFSKEDTINELLKYC